MQNTDTNQKKDSNNSLSKKTIKPKHKKRVTMSKKSFSHDNATSSLVSVTNSKSSNKNSRKKKQNKSGFKSDKSNKVLSNANFNVKQFMNDGSPKVKIIPLGGLNEVGKNMTAIEFDNEIIIIDVGQAFAESDMPGVDAVIQDFTYLRENSNKIQGILLTHGHEDHIGALPYLMREIKCPIYGGKLTIELTRHKLSDKGVSLSGIKLATCKNGDVVKLGKNFKVEFIRVNHSIADSYALAIKTPVGNIIHSGDFKIDYTPINGKVIDLNRFSEYGKKGVLLFMCESTNIEIEGSSLSERQVGKSFERIFEETHGRIIIATFSSHIHRMQQIISAAEKHNRHVCLSGRSMITVFQVANSLGYIDINPDTLIDINDIDNYKDSEIVILTTGSQAEPMSALSRMAFASHRSVEIQAGDTVILSAHPIPGNEKPIYKVINELFKKGADVIYDSLADVHVSGHAYKNELATLHALLKPKFFVPIHGEYRMLYKHKLLANSLGTPESNTFILSNGDILSLSSKRAAITGAVPANPVLIDGSGVADLKNRVLADRRLMAEDGVVSISIVVDDNNSSLATLPVVNSVGFLYDTEAKEIHKTCAAKVTALLSDNKRKNDSIEAEANSSHFINTIKNMLFDKTKRRPIILINVSHINQNFY